CFLMEELSLRFAVRRRRRERKTNSASPRCPLTKIRSPALALDRRTALLARTSPTTIILIRISSRRVVSPPANWQPKRRAARRRPPRNWSSQRRVWLSGRARLSRKHLGSPPMAATSLTARARHFQPTESGGRLARRKRAPFAQQVKGTIRSYPAPA